MEAEGAWVVLPPRVGLFFFFLHWGCDALEKETGDFIASAFFLTSLMHTHNYFHNLSTQLHKWWLVMGKSCLVAVSRGKDMKDGEGWSRGCNCRRERDKGSAQDEEGVYVCICVAGGGMGVSAVNLDVTDWKTVADHYHKSDKR